MTLFLMEVEMMLQGERRNVMAQMMKDQRNARREEGRGMMVTAMRILDEAGRNVKEGRGRMGRIGTQTLMMDCLLNNVERLYPRQ